jgi:hypothetical protein
VGPISVGPLGAAPLTEQEMLAWQMNRRCFLQPWEISFIRRLSREYYSMLGDAERHDCPAPYSERPDAAVIARATGSMRAFLDGMMK